MTSATSQFHRILSIEPTSKGFGFVVLEGRNNLVDWGLREGKGDKNARCLRQIAMLTNLYKPDLIVVEDVRQRSRRRKRVRKLIDEIQKLAQKRKVRTRAVSKVELRKAFSLFGASTKDAIAKVIAERLPELDPFLPPPRQLWNSQNPNIAIFMAAAMGSFE